MRASERCCHCVLQALSSRLLLVISRSSCLGHCVLHVCVVNGVRMSHPPLCPHHLLIRFCFFKIIHSVRWVRWSWVSPGDSPRLQVQIPTGGLWVSTETFSQYLWPWSEAHLSSQRDTEHTTKSAFWLNSQPFKLNHSWNLKIMQISIYGNPIRNPL